MTALPTPFINGAVDEAAFATFVDWLIDEGAQGMVVAGGVGEASTLSWGDRDRLIRIAVEIASGRASVIEAVVANGTDKAVAMMRAAQEAGADAALVTVPYYNKLTQAGMVEHFRTIAASGKLPVLLHNAPADTGVDLLPVTLADLARSEFVIGIADASPDSTRLAKIAGVTQPGILIFSGATLPDWPAASWAGQDGFRSAHACCRASLQSWRLLVSAGISPFCRSVTPTWSLS